MYTSRQKRLRDDNVEIGDDDVVAAINYDGSSELDETLKYIKFCITPSLEFNNRYGNIYIDDVERRLFRPRAFLTVLHTGVPLRFDQTESEVYLDYYIRPISRAVYKQTGEKIKADPPMVGEELILKHANISKKDRDCMRMFRGIVLEHIGGIVRINKKEGTTRLESGELAFGLVLVKIVNADVHVSKASIVLPPIHPRLVIHKQL